MCPPGCSLPSIELPSCITCLPSCFARATPSIDDPGIWLPPCHGDCGAVSNSEIPGRSTFVVNQVFGRTSTSRHGMPSAWVMIALHLVPAHRMPSCMLPSGHFVSIVHCVIVSRVVGSFHPAIHHFVRRARGLVAGHRASVLHLVAFAAAQPPVITTCKEESDDRHAHRCPQTRPKKVFGIILRAHLIR